MPPRAPPALMTKGPTEGGEEGLTRGLLRR